MITINGELRDLPAPLAVAEVVSSLTTDPWTAHVPNPSVED